MIGVTRPHKERVTSIQYSRDGKLLCTTSADKFVWFLENHKADTEFGDVEYTPLGFYLAENPVRSVDWRTDHVVVIAAGSSAIEVELPQDTSTLASLTTATFDISKDLKCTKFAYKRKPTLASAVAVEPLLDPMGNPIEDDGEDEEEEVVAEVLSAIYKRTGLIDETLILSLSEPDEGMLYECKHGNDYALNELVSHVGECRTLRYSSSGKFVLSGSKDGTAYIRAAANPDHFVCVHLHDGNLGEVTSLCTSFDDEFLLTGDSSGCLFVSRIRPMEIEAHAAEAATNNSAMVKNAKLKVMSVAKVNFFLWWTQKTIA